MKGRGCGVKRLARLKWGWWVLERREWRRVDLLRSKMVRGAKEDAR